jgi:hypothetical protein
MYFSPPLYLISDLPAEVKKFKKLRAKKFRNQKIVSV